ncbi:endonuclease V [Stackebrandtia nassauensis]|uniref:Endonuclease V n=1 Tax=Stackebrandtia nassauensis (strain DSM 44728 / CIP 108903 / NRRL B-16338 / NBRC 102104 / LLR-40K-21) TaxID=446470 RepID=D3PZU7_STANL|nr:endonuclease V [Stackebrandtia nassauensis]ADD43634.1 Deoxyribonuclease V [Stackebrandtia nassauensis DSM 44728]
MTKYPWPTDVETAEKLQESLRTRVCREGVRVAPGVVAGVDIAYDKDSELAAAAAVAFELGSLAVVATATVVGRVEFPYRPGLLGFREVPLSSQVLERLDVAAELVVCDGHGLAHPRGFGMACHLGVHMNQPTMGIAKNPPEFAVNEPGKRRGSSTLIFNGDDVVGACLRTQDNVKPVYVSVGHRIGLDEAVEVALRLSPRFRLPATTRAADRLSRDTLAEALG